MVPTASSTDMAFIFAWFVMLEQRSAMLCGVAWHRRMVWHNNDKWSMHTYMDLTEHRRGILLGVHQADVLTSEAKGMQRLVAVCLCMGHPSTKPTTINDRRAHNN